MHSICRMCNVVSESNAEPKLNVDCFSRRFRKVVFDLKLSDLIDSDVASHMQLILE